MKIQNPLAFIEDKNSHHRELRACIRHHQALKLLPLTCTSTQTTGVQKGVSNLQVLIYKKVKAQLGARFVAICALYRQVSKRVNWKERVFSFRLQLKSTYFLQSSQTCLRPPVRSCHQGTLLFKMWWYLLSWRIKICWLNLIWYLCKNLPEPKFEWKVKIVWKVKISFEVLNQTGAQHALQNFLMVS